MDIKGVFKNNFEKQFLKIIFYFYKTKVYFLILSSLFFFPPNSISNGSAVRTASGSCSNSSGSWEWVGIATSAYAQITFEGFDGCIELLRMPFFLTIFMDTRLYFTQATSTW